MNISGLILTIISVLFVVVIIICNKYIRKITNSYFFWLILASFWFAWLLSFRFVPEWIEYINAAPTITDPGYKPNSYIISRAFMLDVCPFFALGILASLILDPSRKIARAMSPIALIGGAITVMSLSFVEIPKAELTTEFIFFGDAYNSCYFIMHFIQVVMAVGVMLNTPRGGWKNCLVTFIMIVIYYCYVLICMSITGCRYNTSGMSIDDWNPGGEYENVSYILGWSPRVCQIIGIPFLILVGCGIIALKDYVFYRGHFLYGNAFSGKWYSWYNYDKYTVQRIL